MTETAKVLIGYVYSVRIPLPFICEKVATQIVNFLKGKRISRVFVTEVDGKPFIETNVQLPMMKIQLKERKEIDKELIKEARKKVADCLYGIRDYRFIIEGIRNPENLQNSVTTFIEEKFTTTKVRKDTDG